MKERRIIYKKDFGELDRIAVKERYYWLEVACGLYPKILADARDIFQKHRALFPTREVLDYFDTYNEMPKHEEPQGKTKHKNYLTLADCSWWFIGKDSHAASLGSFRDALTAWVNSYHLCDWEESTPRWWWVLDVALESMWLWNFHALPTDKQIFYYQGLYTSHTGPHFNFSFHSWAVSDEPWQDYEKRLDDAFKEAKKAYCDEFEKRTEKVSKTQEAKRQKHFTWAVRRQIDGSSAEDMAGSSSPSRSIQADDSEPKATTTVRNALKTVFKRMNVEPRKLDSGPK
jgi:hypothetical protein